MRNLFDNCLWRFKDAEASVIKMLVGGICPWCGSSNLYGRSGLELRVCDACKVEFNELCPICKDKANSLGFNSKLCQYGCDRCGVISDQNYEVLSTEVNKRTLWLTAYSLRANLFVAWLTLTLLSLGLITFMIVIIISPK